LNCLSLGEILKINMKKLITLFVLFTLNSIFSQDRSGTAINEYSSFQNVVLTSHGKQPYYGGGMRIHNNPRHPEGSHYLFDKWENYCIIHTKKDGLLSLDNINLNITTQSFETQVNNEENFVFNFNNINKITINNRVYKRYFDENLSGIYEIVFENEDYKVLKGFKVKLLQGSPNPMVNRTSDKYVRNHFYKVVVGDEISKFRMSRSSIIKLIGKDKNNEIKEFVKKHKLAFNNEIHVKSILTHFLK